jgi:thiol-disulfide isomerase/thioredoxin
MLTHTPINSCYTISDSGPAQKSQTPVTLDTVQHLDFTDLNSDAAKLSDYTEGKDLLVLTLWATWCGPCRLEIPELNLISEEYSDQVRVVSVTTESPQKVNTWLQHLPLDSEQRLTDTMLTDENGQLFESFNSLNPEHAVPLTLIFDVRSKQLVFHKKGIDMSFGATPKQTNKKVYEFVDSRLSQPSQ